MSDSKEAPALKNRSQRSESRGVDSIGTEGRFPTEGGVSVPSHQRSSLQWSRL